MKRVPFEQDLLNTLAAHRPGHQLLSIYVPTTANPAEQKKNEIRLKNAHRKAAAELESAGATEAHCAASLDSLEPLLRADSELWEHRGRGIGIFVDRHDARYVRLRNRIDEFVVATCYYHLKPLYAALPFVAPYFVLALSQNEVALFIGNGISLTRIELDPDVPQSLTDVTGDDLTGPRLQHHGGNRDSTAAIFHGQGAGKDDDEAEIERFLRATDSALRAHHLDGSALVLAGVTELSNHFRRTSKYAGIVDEEISGNVEHLSVDDLHRKAWPIIEHRYRQRRTAELKQLVDGATDRPVVRDLTTIVIAAADGRVERLFIASDKERWGVFDADERHVVTRADRQPADSDLLDVAAAMAHLGGAEVWTVPAVDLPVGSDSIARLRY